MKDKIVNGLITAVVVALVMFLMGGSAGTLGAVSRAPNTDLEVQSITTTADSTIGGGTLTVTTSNTATSTIIGGCYQFYATSTATAHKFQASTTPGVMYSQYGSCPNN